ncbi:hypothetical protein F01_460551 [Burkholderia cenocepacia]|nr:hypothetical protein F01_460551 [Burkholderia cenocepacia]
MRYPGKGLRRGAGDRERQRVRIVSRHLYDVSETCGAFQATHAQRDGDGQRAHRGRRLSRAVRWHEVVELRPTRARPIRRRILHDRQDRLHEGILRSVGRRSGGPARTAGRT